MRRAVAVVHHVFEKVLHYAYASVRCYLAFGFGFYFFYYTAVVPHLREYVRFEVNAIVSHGIVERKRL